MIDLHQAARAQRRERRRADVVARERDEDDDQDRCGAIETLDAERRSGEAEDDDDRRPQFHLGVITAGDQRGRVFLPPDIQQQLALDKGRDDCQQREQRHSAEVHQRVRRMTGDLTEDIEAHHQDETGHHQGDAVFDQAEPACAFR